MTDPFEALREPAPPTAPAPEFAARLRERLTRAVLDQPRLDQPRGDTMPTPAPATRVTATRAVPREPAAVTPYLVVSDARRALDWYVEVFDARRRGDLYVNPDGTIGHAEVWIGDGVVMFAEPSDLYPDTPVRAPESPTTFTSTVHLRVPDVDAVFARATARGAAVEREPGDQPYGRAAVIVDPFGHRWLLNTPPGAASPRRQGDVARVTMVTGDAERARDFYEEVLRVPFAVGRAPGSWVAEETRPQIALWSPPDAEPEVQLCFGVDDVEAAVARVRAAGGTAGAVETKPYGLLVECVDDQGTRFQLWQPAG